MCNALVSEAATRLRQSLQNDYPAPTVAHSAVHAICTVPMESAPQCCGQQPWTAANLQLSDHTNNSLMPIAWYNGEIENISLMSHALPSSADCYHRMVMNSVAAAVEADKRKAFRISILRAPAARDYTSWPPSGVRWDQSLRTAEKHLAPRASSPFPLSGAKQQSKRRSNDSYSGSEFIDDCGKISPPDTNSSPAALPQQLMHPSSLHPPAASANAAPSLQYKGNTIEPHESIHHVRTLYEPSTPNKRSGSRQREGAAAATLSAERLREPLTVWDTNTAVRRVCCNLTPVFDRMRKNDDPFQRLIDIAAIQVGL
jgi:hypothetical protein